MRCRILLAVPIAIALTACGSSGTHWTAQDFEDFGYHWPLTVDAGTLDCSHGMVTFKPDDDGTVYAVNGTAKGSHKYADIAPIWAAGDDGLPKQDISDLVKMGLVICSS